MKSIAPPTLPGIGHPYQVYFNDRRSIMAIAFYHDNITSPRGRACYQGQQLRYGVALYEPGSSLPVAVFNDLKFGANDIAFHPVKPVIAIGGGSYDGGYLFEGEFALFDWKQKKAWQVLHKTPEIVRCHFSSCGSSLSLLTHPWDEGDFKLDAFSTFHFHEIKNVEAILSGKLSLGRQVAMPHPLKPVDPTEKGFSGPIKDWQGQNVGQSIAEFLNVEFSDRSAIRDLKWINNDQVAAAHDDCLLEIFDENGARLQSFDGDATGAQIFLGNPLILHANAKPDSSLGSNGEGSYRGSELYELNGAELLKAHGFKHDYVFSRAADGSLLGRCDRNGFAKEKGQDIFLRKLSGPVVEKDLGNFDCFNHFCRFDGADRHYFFQSMPKEDHRDKYACSFDEQDDVARLWPILEGDGTDYTHPMELATCFGVDDLGAGLFVAGRRHMPSPSKGGHTGFLYRRIPEWSEDVWYHDVESCVSMMVCHSRRPLLAVAFLNGDLWFLHSETGEILSKQGFEPEGLATAIYALDMFDDKIAVGCLDGRIFVGAIEEFGV